MTQNYPLSYEEKAALSGRLVRGFDRVTLASGGGSFAWVLQNPGPNVPIRLIRRDIRSFEGGGIEYFVFYVTNPSDYTVHSTQPAILFGPTATQPVSRTYTPQATWRRLEAFNPPPQPPSPAATFPAAAVGTGTGMLTDLDWISGSGSGSNASGGTAGGQAVRISPPSGGVDPIFGTTFPTFAFVVLAVNTASQDRTFDIRILWSESLGQLAPSDRIFQ